MAQGNCPRCNSDNLEFGSIELGSTGDTLYYPVECKDCGFKCREWYNLTFAEFTDEDGSKINTEIRCPDCGNKLTSSDYGYYCEYCNYERHEYEKDEIVVEEKTDIFNEINEVIDSMKRLEEKGWGLVEVKDTRNNACFLCGDKDIRYFIDGTGQTIYFCDCITNGIVAFDYIVDFFAKFDLELGEYEKGRSH